MRVATSTIYRAFPEALRKQLGDDFEIAGRFCECVKEGDIAGMKLMLAAQADVNRHGYRRGKFYNSPLVTAMVNGHLEAVKFLTNHGANLYAVNEEWPDPIEQAQAIIEEHPRHTKVLNVFREQCIMFVQEARAKADRRKDRVPESPTL